MSTRLILQLFFIFVVFANVSSCGTNPVTGKTELQLVSKDEEIQIGAQNYAPSQQSQGGKYFIDPALQKYISDVGQKLAQVSDRPDLPYEFVILNNSVPNAWALPGGKIAVNRGLLTELKSEAELAAVLAHEIVHAAARHGAKSMERDMMLSAGMATIGMATADKNAGQLIVGAATLGSSLISSKYGRDAESEADKYGMQYMVRAGYDPYAAVELQETFVRMANNRESNWLEGLFASHPPSADRVVENKNTARKLGVNGFRGEQEYRAKISHLIATQPAYEAYEKGKKALQDKQPDQALAMAQQALKLEPKEALFALLKGDAFASKKQFADAQQAYSEAVKLNDNYFLPYLKRGLLFEQTNQLAPAKTDLEKSISLLPTTPAYLILGNFVRNEKNLSLAKQYYSHAAQSQSEFGTQAAVALAKIEIPENPQKYIALEASANRQQTLDLIVTNKAPLGVSDIHVTIRIKDQQDHILYDEKYSLSGPLEQGKSGMINTRIPASALNRSNSIKASITQARVVD